MEKLNYNQQQMVSDLLLRTNSQKDIDDFSERILGNAYGDKKTMKAYRELAAMRLKIKQ